MTKFVFNQLVYIASIIFNWSLVELSISSDSDANIDEKDIVQSDPEIDEDSDEETLMIK